MVITLQISEYAGGIVATILGDGCYQLGQSIRSCGKEAVVAAIQDFVDGLLDPTVTHATILPPKLAAVLNNRLRDQTPPRLQVLEGRYGAIEELSRLAIEAALAKQHSLICLQTKDTCICGTTVALLQADLTAQFTGEAHDAKTRHNIHGYIVNWLQRAIDQGYCGRRSL